METKPAAEPLGQHPSRDARGERSVSAFIYSVTFATTQPRILGQFWSAVTGYAIVDERDDFVKLQAPANRSVRHLLSSKSQSRHPAQTGYASTSPPATHDPKSTASSASAHTSSTPPSTINPSGADATVAHALCSKTQKATSSASPRGPALRGITNTS